MLILAADIGNTTITLGVLRGEACLATARTPSRPMPGVGAEALRHILERFREEHGDFGGAVLASVVPGLTHPVEEALAEAAGVRPLRLTHDTPLPVRNGYARQREVGLDRLANAVGGLVLCGAPAIVVDAGTAVTVDVVSPGGVFLGGAILPGAELWAKALNDFTAALPRVDVTAPERAIGTTTDENIRSGIVHGLAGAVDRLVELARAEMGGNAPAVLTGGGAPLLLGHCRTVEHHEECLTLVGLAHIFEYNGRFAPRQ